MVFGSAVALAQNSGEKKIDPEDHQCTPEMMEDMAKNCPEGMMQSGACENMMNSGNSDSKGKSHCDGMGSGTGSMMGGVVDMKVPGRMM